VFGGSGDDNPYGCGLVRGAGEKGGEIRLRTFLYSLKPGTEDIGTWRHARKLECAIVVGTDADARRV
jgi:lysophospholipid acyltransferase (LPLAT)-like uncharacterized protein